PDTTLAPPSLPHGSAVMAALRVRRPPIPTLFPYTTLFRSLADEADDLGQRRAPARPRHAEAEGARPVDRPPDDGLARPLFYRQRLAREHRLVHRARALDDGAVEGDALAGADGYHLAHGYLGHRHLHLGPAADDPRHGGLEVHQPA